MSTDGTIYGGAAAFAEWLKFRGGAYGIVGRVMDLPVIRALAAAVYRVIAKNRHRMPGGSPACALPPPGFDPAQPGTKRSNGANASQQIAVGAKWMYKIAKVNNVEPHPEHRRGEAALGRAATRPPPPSTRR